MKVSYRVERLGPMFEADLSGVAFEDLTNCPVCDSTNLTVVARLKDSITTSVCNACSHTFHSRRPTQKWIEDWYRSAWDGASTRRAASNGLPLVSRVRALAETARRRVRTAVGAVTGTLVRDTNGTAVYDFCRPILREGASVLDIGCGYGGELRQFAERGMQCFGIEASPHRAEAARLYGIQTRNAPVEALGLDTFGTAFDVVISNHVLEHAYDPHAFFQAIRRVLKPGGWVCVTVPNVSGGVLLQDFFFALHLHLYSRTSLETLASLNGFSVERILEEHQLRILARPSTSAELRRPFGVATSNPSAEDWIRACFGNELQLGTGDFRFLGWHAAPAPQVGQVYDVEYARSVPKHERVVALKCSGEKAFPLEFVRHDDPERPVPFWVK